MRLTLTGIEEIMDEAASGIATLDHGPAQRHIFRKSDSPLAGARDRGENFDALILDVQGMARLKANWDLYGGSPPDKDCIEFAVQVLRYAMEAPDCPIPIVKPIPSGVFIDWNLGTTRLYFEADTDSVLAVSDDGQGIVDREFSHGELDIAYAIIYNFMYGLNNAECVY